MPAEVEPIRYARTACLPCRRSKRRCDRKVPICDLCTRKEVECSYPTRRNRDQALVAVQSRIDSSSDTLSTQGYSQNDEHERYNNLPIRVSSSFRESNANAIYFIAPHIFQQVRLELPRLDLPISPEVSALIGDASSIRDIAAKFFMTIHRWLPIISKRGFFACLLNPLAQRRVELSLLALCMKLCCTAPSDEDWDHDNKPSIYRIAKRFHYEAETAGVLSIYVLQAGILIAFYEMGHGIYPAAYLTVGACARYGLALGADMSCFMSLGDGDGQRSWNELEERKRAWWAVLIFDRFLSLSNPKRSLSTEDPTFDTYLPVDDVVWDEWGVRPGDAVRISTGFTLKMGIFARLAQITYLLSQALRAISTTATEGNMTSQDHMAQIRRTMLAHVHTVDRESTIRRLEFCAPSAVSLSAILLLQEHHLKGDPNVDNENTRLLFEMLWEETQTALNRLSLAAVSYVTSCPHNPDASDSIPIFLIHAMYQVACMFLRLSQGVLDVETSDKIEKLRTLLQRVALRWRLAGIYLDILEAQEVTISSESIRTPHSLLLTRLDSSSNIIQTCL